MVAFILSLGTGLIDFDEFLNVMTSKIGEHSSRRDLGRVFKLFDTDNTDFISLENMKRISQEVGDNLTEEELKDVLKRCDIDQDSQCRFEDFYNVITQKLH